MFTTVRSSSHKDYSFSLLAPERVSLKENQNLKRIRLSSEFQQTTPTQQECEQSSVETDNWNMHLNELREVIAEALVARKTAQYEYKKAQAEANAWEKRLQVALENGCQDQVYQAVGRRESYTDRSHQFKAAIRSYSASISTIKSQLAFWGNQLAF